MFHMWLVWWITRGGVDFDSSGKYIVVADQGNHRIQVFDAESHGVMCNFGKKGFGPKDFLP